MSLCALLKRTSKANPDATALLDFSGNSITYGEYYAHAKLTGEALIDLFTEFASVVLITPKSIGSAILIQACLINNVCYVPFNVYRTIDKNLSLFHESPFELAILPGNCYSELKSNSLKESLIPFTVLSETFYILRNNTQKSSVAEHEKWAFIMSTSGSTGRPKEIGFTDENVFSFIAWCQSEFRVQKGEVLLSVAPWCFDLSVMDLYLSIHTGSTLLISSENESANPQLVVKKMIEEGVNHVYATPTWFQTMTTYGNLNETMPFILKRVLFAGEVFHIKPLNTLRKYWSAAEFYNLYGPTETNVCTFYKLPQKIENERAMPYPIGQNCSSVLTKTVHGQLHVTGSFVGTLHARPENDKAFLERYEIDKEGRTWFKTGDLVEQDRFGNYHFQGRVDRQIKRNGYRIELDEIESLLYGLPSVRMAAVLSVNSSNCNNEIHAFVVGHKNSQFDMLTIRQELIKSTERYKIPNLFHSIESLPVTATGKIDYQLLQEKILNKHA